MRHLLGRLRQALRRLLRLQGPVRFHENVLGADGSSLQRRALVLYVVKAFSVPEGDPRLLVHQNARQCKQIAELLGSFGYIVDVLDVNGQEFRPPRRYDLILSNRSDLLGVRSILEDCPTRLYLATVTNPRVHNASLRRRHQMLWKRRGRKVQLRRLYSESMPFLERADALIGFGNEGILKTWQSDFGGPRYAFNNYGFRETRFPFESKDFDLARRGFLYFASASQMQKGLDLLLEVFPRHPELQLYVCSYFQREQDFCACYHKELFETPNIHPVGWVPVNGPRFYELVHRCAHVILPSCSEGQPGSVVQCMHAGLSPLVTAAAGIDTEDFGVTFQDDSLEEIERVVLESASRPAEFHRGRGLRTRQVAEARYSEAAFLARWSAILGQILGRPPDRLEEHRSQITTPGA